MKPKLVLVWPNVLRVALALSAASFLSGLAVGFLDLGVAGGFTLGLVLGMMTGGLAGVIWPCVRFEWY